MKEYFRRKTDPPKEILRVLLHPSPLGKRNSTRIVESKILKIAILSTLKIGLCKLSF
jgi:hypothetical protein